MKTYRNMFEKMLPPETVAKCALDAADGKLNRPEVLYAFAHFDRTYDHVVACALDPEYRPCEDNTHEIIDGANGKKRAIEKPRFNPEQILHHMLMEPFKEVLLNGLYEQVYGCIPKLVTVDRNGKKHVRKFGPHAAIKQLKKWIQTGKKTYVAEMDVKSAYGSVHIPTLAGLLRETIKDTEWLRLMFQFLHYRPNDETGEARGLILGHFPSPWLFNFYLKKFDHFAAKLPDVKYLRYADNLFLVGRNKRKARRAVDSIREYLWEELKLELNGSRQIYRFEYGTGETDKKGKEKARGRAVNALGAKIHHNRTTLRKSILMRIRRKAIKVEGKGKFPTWHDGASMFARLSWVRHTDTFTYYLNHIKPRINTRRLKQKVRMHSKAVRPIAEKRRNIINDGLEKSARLAEREAS